MSKLYFCSYCGLELTYSRKALKNKGIIRDLIDPHDCDDSNMENIVDADKPTKGAVTPAESTEVTQEEKKELTNIKDAFDLGLGDKRDSKHKRESSGESPVSAPSSVEQMIKDESKVSEPEGDL
jgi:hypothetical protein